MSTPTIRGTTAAGTGTTYIPVDRLQAQMSIQFVANGTVTFTIDGTGDNVLYDTATIAAANMQGRKDLVDPSAAMWDEIVASGSSSGDAFTERKFRALRIAITAGSGSVTYVINQGGGA